MENLWNIQSALQSAVQSYSPSWSLIVNTAAGCYSHGQALALNMVTPAHFCSMFWQRKKSECFKCFERFTMSVTRVFSLGEKFSNSSSASEINGSGCGYQLRWKLSESLWGGEEEMHQHAVSWYHYHLSLFPSKLPQDNLRLHSFFL